MPNKKILISADGGLGDHITAEPAIRYLIKLLGKNAEVHIAAHWPRVYEHLGVPVHEHNFDRKGVEYQTLWTLFNHGAPLWQGLCFLAAHMVDFHSMLLMQRMLPLKDREIKLLVKEEDRTNLRALMGTAPSSVVAVHAGKSWATKTFPLAWWQEVVDALAASGITVCLFGKSDPHMQDDTTGLVPVVCPQNGIDLRDKLELGPLFALLESAPVLLTNDSSPVQIAGAFDNHIVMLATIKYPDLVFPYRRDSTGYKTKALYKKLMADEIFGTFDLSNVTVDFEVSDFSLYLPEPQEIIKEVLILTPH